MARPSTQEASLATPEQLCMLGLYAVGASLLSTFQQTSPPFPAQVSCASKYGVERKSMAVDRPVSSKPPQAPAEKSVKQSKRNGKSLDLFSHPYAVPTPCQPLMNDFSFNASRLGITGDVLPAEMPPSPFSSHVELPCLQQAEESPRSKVWFHYLTPSWVRSQPGEDHRADGVGKKQLRKQRSRSRLPSVTASSRREQRSASDPDTGFSTSYVPARLGDIPFLPRQQDAAPQPRARSMSLDVPRLARKSMTALRAKKPPSATVKNEPAPRLGQPALVHDRDYQNCDLPQQKVDLSRFPLRDLPRESTSSSDSDYSYDRRHSISGSSGHESLHARARGHSEGSFASTAPSTVSKTAVTSTSTDTHKSDSDEDQESEDDDEDDIEWERPAFRPTCVSPIAFEHMPTSPSANRGHGPRSFQAARERPRLPSFSSYSKSQSKEASKVPFATSMLRGPRRMTSASSIGEKSADSAKSGFSERARRSFSQARSLLTVPSPRSEATARRSTADDVTRPAAVFLHPIHTGVISRPCQTMPNSVSFPSSSSNSVANASSATKAVDGSSMQYPSSYLGTFSESGSVTGGSSGNSSGNSSGGRSWESTAPELAALEELVLTECKYLADLQLLLDVYVEGLRRMGLVTPASLEKLVTNLDEVMAFSKFLIDTVRAYLPRRATPPTSIASHPSNSDGSPRHHPQQVTNQPFLTEPDYLGLSTKLVKELPARMEVYARYCMAHQAARERLSFECELRPAVAAFIELTRSTNPTLQGMDMSQFLVLPVQRVTRYPLLFGCLAKECGKRRFEGHELREEDEDPEVAHQSGQRQERAEAICSNWARLRDASSSICGLTNLAISYQQQPIRPETLRTRPRQSVSSPLLSSSNGTPFGSMHLATPPPPPPPALVGGEQASKHRPAPAITEKDLKPRSSTFSRSPWRKSSATTSDKSQTGSTAKPPASLGTPSGVTPPTSSSASSSNGSSTSFSFLSRFVKAFKHPSA